MFFPGGAFHSEIAFIFLFGYKKREWTIGKPERMAAMPGLINELKREHREILTLLRNVGELGVATPEGWQAMLEARGGLFDHLQKEDERLYPPLIEKAKEDAEVQVSMAFYDAHLKEIAGQLSGFYNRCEAPGVDREAEFVKLVRFMRGRVMWEEEVLFPQYSVEE